MKLHRLLLIPAIRGVQVLRGDEVRKVHAKMATIRQGIHQFFVGGLRSGNESGCHDCRPRGCEEFEVGPCGAEAGPDAWKLP